MQETTGPDQAHDHEDTDDAAKRLICLFSTRLNTVLDGAGFPNARAGRYSTLGSKYGVTRQQAHRWCNEQAIPAPHILTKIAVDFGTTLDWLFGVDAVVSAGVEIPLYRLNSPEAEALQSNFEMIGRMRFLSSSLVAKRNYAIVQNWVASLDPPFSRGEELLVNLSSQELEDDACYIIRTATSTSVRKFSLQSDGVTLRFHRTTLDNTYTSNYQINEAHRNAEQRFDADWRQPGVLILGRVEATTRSLLAHIPTFLSS